MTTDSDSRDHSTAPQSSDVFFLFEDTTENEKRSVARNILDTHVRERIENSMFRYSVQSGLEYQLDTDSLIDDFIYSIDNVALYPEEDTFGAVRIDIIASTIDTAKVTKAPGEPPTQTAPSFENTTWVKCSIKASCQFTITGVTSDVAVSISQHPMSRPDTDQH